MPTVHDLYGRTAHIEAMTSDHQEGCEGIRRRLEPWSDFGHMYSWYITRACIAVRLPFRKRTNHMVMVTSQRSPPANSGGTAH